MRDLEGLRRLVNEKLEMRPGGGPSKVLPLEYAISRFTRPGMAIHLSSMPRPMAAIFSLIRAYRGTSPRFTAIVSSFISAFGGSALVRAGIIKKIITSYTGIHYPNPSPSRVVQKGYRDGTLEVENWSFLSQTLRLKAAAHGLPFAATRSILGSTMEHDNAHAFRAVDNPFHPGQRVGVASALYPDVALFHALAADEQGNAIVAPPSAENVWGPLAAREGVILSVERIVPTDFIRRHAHLVRVPGYVVRSVSEVPFGAHPSAVNNQWVEGVDGYAEDYDFLMEARSADASDEKLDDWMDRWVWSARNHQKYLDKVGYSRLMFLRGKAQKDSYSQEFESVIDLINLRETHNPVEHMIVVASRLIADLAEKKNYNTVLAGIGAANLAVWIANSALKDKGIEIELMAEAGFFGYTPRPADPFIFNHRNISTAKSLSDFEQVLGAFTGGVSNSCLGALGAAQVDKHGNINTTIVPPKHLLVGSGGGNDVASGSREVIVILPQVLERFLDRVPYVTSPGRAVRTVVSTLGVYERAGEEEELVLTGYLASSGGNAEEEEVVREIKSRCGWNLKIAPELRRHEAPNEEELHLLRVFDPHRQFLNGV